MRKFISALLIVGLGLDRAAVNGQLRGETREFFSETGAAVRALVEGPPGPEFRPPGFSQHRNALRLLYRSVDYDLVWLRAGKPTPQAIVIIRNLAAAEQKGLRPEDYDGSHWAERAVQVESTPSVAGLAGFDVTLSSCAIRYASDLESGRVNPRLLQLGLNVRDDERELAEVVQRLAAARDIDSELAAVEPQFPGYRRSLKALTRYLALARADGGEPLPVPQAPIQPGSAYPGVPRLTRLLRLLGDLPPDAALPAHEVYGGALVPAVQRFQARHGLEKDGRMSAATVRQLNMPLAQRVRQLQLALERWRWLPRKFPSPPLVVNIPEFRLHVDDSSFHWLFSMKVVVGRAWRHQTPIFTGMMDSVIFRPFWNVPRDILVRELLPEIEKAPESVPRSDFEIVDAHGALVTGGAPDAATIARLRDGELRLRQKPGERNALGSVKFFFPNAHHVYLHGTASPKLFSRTRRDFSHGCIRVEDPEQLVRWALQGDPVWPPDRIRAALNGEETIRVKLIHPIPVLILYSTAVVMEDGEARFFDDIYGLDKALERALARRGRA